MIALATSQSTGANLPRLSPSVLAEFLIPLPPIAEQKRIAAILDKAEEVRSQRRQALAQLDALTQSIFLEMFGDPVTNQKKWQQCKLSNLCDHSDNIKCGPFSTQLNREEYQTSGIALWGIKHVNSKFRILTSEFISERKAKELTAYSLEPNDIVMTRKGTIGNCAVFPKEFELGIMHSDLLRVRINELKCETSFLTHQLQNSRDIERQISLISGGAVMPGINVSKLKEILVLVPPLPLQQEFAQRVNTIAQLKASHRESLAHLDALFVHCNTAPFAANCSA
jgi:type I restriction enzyme, S subunit